MVALQQPKLVHIPADTFLFGIPAEPPATVQHPWSGPHRVEVGAFLIAECSVTVGEFIAFLTETKGEIPEPFAFLSEQRADWPAGGISWHDACEYAAWMRDTSGLPYRLPACDEWEAAARGGLTGRAYPWGDEEPVGRSNFTGPGQTVILPVRSFEPNGYGLYDMAGSIWNWCADLWNDRITHDAPVNKPTGSDPKHNRILRGGSYMTLDPGYLMCAYIHEDPPDLRHRSVGMRLACDPH